MAFLAGLSIRRLCVWEEQSQKSAVIYLKLTGERFIETAAVHARNILSRKLPRAAERFLTLNGPSGSKVTMSLVRDTRSRLLFHALLL